ncbi:hypothetical protein E2562_037783 [Oryza meyeriana var. granulata]|uniref:Uncharacterized protein n=1 Tax=Oryza meyeriana var. granulata TaxID=110450 RepID=A0A6G1E8N9_9ORYZ|nr:hypothetical protein E2562_037783 [Oryza meyeriana var. granulata]
MGYSSIKTCVRGRRLCQRESITDRLVPSYPRIRSWIEHEGGKVEEIRGGGRRRWVFNRVG